jgi:hypothetical protein
MMHAVVRTWASPPLQAPLLVDFRDNSNEAEIKMTLQFASTAKAQVGAHLKTSQLHLSMLRGSHMSRVVCCGSDLQVPLHCRRWWRQARTTG